ncbi:hypothetical protein [Streptomyces sp. NBC_01794]|uniref:hypothetical protein n=1 Tax=Streptomyces sp. NBC_01794 TaxID=2975942 RepID=UPI003091A1CE|nr:hypothetical protein OIE54_09985 [Streptomyces sp. NBC_01794]
MTELPHPVYGNLHPLHVNADGGGPGPGRRGLIATQAKVCRTAEEAFWAGYNAPCEHDVPDPNDCPYCRLTDAEIGRMTVLHQPYLTQRTRASQAA